MLREHQLYTYLSGTMARKLLINVFSIIFCSVVAMYVINKFISRMELVKYTPIEYHWIVNGVVNIVGYGTLFLPGYLTLKYIRSVNFRNIGDGPCIHIIQLCFGEDEFDTNVNSFVTPQRTSCQQGLLIVYHFIGLQLSYLTWGILQEKVMTQAYHSGTGQTAYFKDSQFLVFVNRILALSISFIYLSYKKQNRLRCPLYKFSFCSFSNIMSSWCQYEALKYVSFPHQVLAKAAKTIPVMIMGKVVLKAKYELYEYVTSIVLSVGMLLFMLDAGNDRAKSVITTFSGAVLLVLYIVFDSFTSNWQGSLFKSYNIKPVQMMCFVNLYSVILTSISLIQQETFFTSLNFMTMYPQFFVDCIMLSVCSASGQLFIFSTISKFGPLIFAVITTIRQGLSVLLSCIIYNHPISMSGVIGLIFIFASVLIRIYYGHRNKNVRNLNVKQQIEV